VKRFLMLLLLALLIPAALSEGGLPAPLTADTNHIIDLDGDGTTELFWWTHLDRRVTRFTVEDASGDVACLDMDIYFDEGPHPCDVDGDGLLELLLNRHGENEYVSCWCMQYRNGELYSVLFPHSFQGSVSTTYYDTWIPGELIAQRDGSITIRALLNPLFQVYFYLLDLRPTLHGRFEPVDAIYYLDEDKNSRYYYIQTIVDLNYESGGPQTLPAGTWLKLTRTDFSTFADFVTEDGLDGRFTISEHRIRSYENDVLFTIQGLTPDEAFTHYVVGN